MKPAAFFACFALLAVVSAASARDLTTTDGVTYTNAVLKRVEPDGITISHVGGLVKLHPSKLPEELREKFHFNAQQAAEYARQQAAEVHAASERRDAFLLAQQKAEEKRLAAEKKKKSRDAKTRGWELYCVRSGDMGVIAYDHSMVYYFIPGCRTTPQTWFYIEAVPGTRTQITPTLTAIPLSPHPIPASRKK